ncbi:MAG: Ig-like domain-containing protein [Candidatus Peribacteria bacterium]|jgi:hypothetical protein|nr:Ig-like domain-containing protein [Candidatus Peribacteria bacterium]
MKLTINYAEALGPVIWDQALSGGVRSGLGADLKSYLSEPFKERGEAMKDYGQEREAEYNDIFSSERDQNENNLLQLETQAVLESNSLTEGDTQNPNKDTKKLYQYYTKVKTYVDSNTIDEKHSSITLDLTSNTDLGSMEFIITSTGAGCFQIDGKSLCNGGKRNSRINPNIATTSLKITPTDKKAGISLIQIKICIPGTQDCVTKTQRITTKEGPLDHFKIQSKSPTTPRGMLTSVTITARDANENPIDWANDEFVIQVNEGKFLNDGMYTTEFTTNRFKNLTVYYQAPISGTTTTATMEVVSSSLLGTGKLWTSKQQQIIDAKPLIRLDGKDIITTLGGSANSTIQLKNTDNTTAFQKVDLFIKNPEGQNINIDTEVSIKAKNKLVDIGILEDKNFKKRSTLTLSGGQLSFWYRPTNVAGNEEVSIQIPGLTPFTIKLEIKPAPAQIVEMQISQENIKI